MTRKILSLVFAAGVFGAAFLPLRPANAAGASLYLSPSAGTKAVGATFSVSIKVNSGGNVINAAEGTLNYDGAILETVNTSKAGSIFPFWTSEPSAAGGVIRFGGGLPPPAFNGASGQIISVTFKAKKAGEAKINFSSGAVLANDGKGTNIVSGLGGASFIISAAPAKTETPPTKTDPAKPSEPAREAEKDYNKPVIRSSTHPDPALWYRERAASFSWDLPQGVSAVSLAFDQQEGSDPGTVSDGNFSEKILSADKDGAWYLHLRFKDQSRWGTTGHFRVNIDSVPPEELKVSVAPALPGEWPILAFTASDALSGLAKFLVHIGSLDEQTHELPPEQAQMVLSGLGIGEYTAMVRAVDRAGNERLETVKFRIEPIAAPLITNYPGELKANDNFYVSGTAEGAAMATINVEQDGKIVMSADAAVDSGGNWLHVFSGRLDNGRYAVWAEAVNANGIGSLPSEKKSFLVSPPVFMVIGDFVINYFTVFASLLFLIVVIVVLILWIIGLVRKKLKQETGEVETILKRGAEEIKQAIEIEFAAILSERLKSERLKAKDRLIAKVDDSRDRAIKEIKDVEELLK